MAEPKPFTPAKLVCGIIFAEARFYDLARDRLVEAFGVIDHESQGFPFDLTDYYAPEMGPELARRFMSFRRLVEPDRLAGIKLFTNGLEVAVGPGPASRRVNIDPGILTGAALFMATAKDFAQRVPLGRGIYAHLELLFTKTGVRFLDWTYPDFRRPGPLQFLRAVRSTYLEQIRKRRT
jgi:hypothetical protein